MFFLRRVIATSPFAFRPTKGSVYLGAYFQLTFDSGIAEEDESKEKSILKRALCSWQMYCIQLKVGFISAESTENS